MSPDALDFRLAVCPDFLRGRTIGWRLRQSMAHRIRGGQADTIDGGAGIDGRSLAKAVKCSPAAISAIAAADPDDSIGELQQRLKRVSRDRVIAMAECLGVSPDWMLTGNGPEPAWLMDARTYTTRAQTIWNIFDDASQGDGWHRLGTSADNIDDILHMEPSDVYNDLGGTADVAIPTALHLFSSNDFISQLVTDYQYALEIGISRQPLSSKDIRKIFSDFPYFESASHAIFWRDNQSLSHDKEVISINISRQDIGIINNILLEWSESQVSKAEFSNSPVHPWAQRANQFIDKFASATQHIDAEGMLGRLRRQGSGRAKTKSKRKRS